MQCSSPARYFAALNVLEHPHMIRPAPHHARVVIVALASLAVVAAAEFAMGRSAFGTDGRFDWWDGNIWSNENSQRVADAYTFSHICHGMLTYGLLFLVARRMPLSYRFFIALMIEGAWEILENSPIIINRYRAATISVGYTGDSVLNSVCDVVFMSLGFWMAHTVSIRTTIALILAMEVGCLLWVRDNLTLNVLMLIRPIEAIKVWQAEGHSGERMRP
jgi:hypothetical protein